MNEVVAAGVEARQAPSPPRADSVIAPILPHILRIFRREPALALTGTYLLVALAGIYYDYGFYQVNFGIPVLTLAQISDFLVAGLQQPVAIALVVLTLPLCWIFDRLNMRSNRKRVVRGEQLRALPHLKFWQKLQLYWDSWKLSKLERRLSQILYLGLILLYSWVFIGVLTDFRADAILHGSGPHVTLRLVGEAADLRTSTGTSWSYLGAVSSYVFVYDAAAKRAMILPTTAIARIQPVPPASIRKLAAKP